jgi:hypothetical protein
MVTVLRLTFTILSIIGHIITRPGPFNGITLPSLKTTPLSYSFSIFIALESTYTAKKIINRSEIKDVSNIGTSF